MNNKKVTSIQYEVVKYMYNNKENIIFTSSDYLECIIFCENNKNMFDYVKKVTTFNNGLELLQIAKNNKHFGIVF